MMINELQIDLSDQCSVLTGEIVGLEGDKLFCMIVTHTGPAIPSFNLCMSLDTRNRFIQFWKGHDDAPTG